MLRERVNILSTLLFCLTLSLLPATHAAAAIWESVNMRRRWRCQENKKKKIYRHPVLKNYRKKYFLNCIDRYIEKKIKLFISSVFHRCSWKSFLFFFCLRMIHVLQHCRGKDILLFRKFLTFVNFISSFRRLEKIIFYWWSKICVDFSVIFFFFNWAE